jgi:hypothetical protein
MMYWYLFIAATSEKVYSAALQTAVIQSDPAIMCASRANQMIVDVPKIIKMQWHTY